MLVELMNENKETRDVVPTITYEFIPIVPPAFNKVATVWLDIGGCDGSEMPAKNGTFEYSMEPAWKANFSGRITTMITHLHDGGTHLEVKQNNKTICDSMAAYGQSAGYNESMNSGMDMSGMDMGMAMTHISSMTTCDMIGQVNVDDEWSVTAHYNMTAYTPMMSSNGTLEPIMGIALFYVAKGENATTNGTATSTGDGSSVSGAASTTSPTAVSTGSYVQIGTSLLALCLGLLASLL